jgi:UDP-N-acetylmuramyl pentapeptide phosphotransferase/UDP-N-acetylglucosamine-1-phosphate transferase
MIYLFIFLFSFTLTYFIKNYAIKKSLIAEVNERSSHMTPTPHGGGIAISITWLIGLIYLNINNQIDPNLFYALLVGLGISAISFIDDIIDLKPKIRMIAHFLFATVGLWFLGGLNSIDFGLFSISNDYYISSIIGIVAIVYFINIANFMDGLNGFIGSEMLFLSIAGFVLFGDAHFVVLAVSVLGFLYWNFGNHAKIFLGGSR